MQTVESSPRGDGYTDDDVTLSQLVRPQFLNYSFFQEQASSSIFLELSPVKDVFDQ